MIQLYSSNFPPTFKYHVFYHKDQTWMLDVGVLVDRAVCRCIWILEVENSVKKITKQKRMRKSKS